MQPRERLENLRRLKALRAKAAVSPIPDQPAGMTRGDWMGVAQTDIQMGRTPTQVSGGVLLEVTKGL
ncbi:MAG: hypothetical protein KJN90_01300, partial [Gammaproteobacteria bacterium]|nr:hypothetical protein [Gammaproteobacteria bacterium]